MNPVIVVEKFFGPKVYKPTLVLAGVALVTWLIPWGFFQFFFFASLICLASIAIWRAGDHFTPAAEFIEDHHNIPQSVKAAIIDAIASSFPEFAVAVIAVITLGRFEVGVATIAGSALYNVLVIPAAAGLVATTPMLVSKEVVWRDNLFYFVVVIVLLLAVWATDAWGLGIGLMFLIIYGAYMYLLQKHYKSHQAQSSNDKAVEETPDDEEEQETAWEISSEKGAWVWILGMMLLMGFASHVLVEASISLGDLLGIDAVVMAFIVIAAGTSAPDTALSVISARKGNYDAAISNVFGSNIFDICICLSVPILMVFIAGGGATAINMPHMELLFILLASTILAFYFFYSDNYTLNKKKCKIMAGLYIAIVLYAMMLG